MIPIYISNDNTIELHNVTNSVTGVADTGATVTVTLTDGSGTEVTGQTWPTTMAWDATDSVYRASLNAEMSLRRGGTYIASISATGSAGELASWELQVKAQPRSVF